MIKPIIVVKMPCKLYIAIVCHSSKRFYIKCLTFLALLDIRAIAASDWPCTFYRQAVFV